MVHGFDPLIKIHKAQWNIMDHLVSSYSVLETFCVLGTLLHLHWSDETILVFSGQI